MESLARDCHKLSKHQAASTQKAVAAVDSAIRELEAARAAAAADNMAGLQQARRQVERAQRTVGEQLKELYTNVAKYSKHVDKAFKLDLGYVAESRAFEDKREELAQSILQHFLREGDFETARVFAQEARLALPAEMQRQFEDMYAMVAAIRGPEHELGPALEWAVARRAELEAAGIALEFALHRLRFLQLVEGGQTIEALRYAREWFPRFGRAATQGGEAAAQLEEIERLMGVVIYARRLEASPYAGQFAAQRWEDGARAFASAFCRLLGLAAESPLSVTIDAGARALPVVCKVAGLLRDKRTEWSQQNELPAEVPLPDTMRFHSVFACPVSKEQASPDNPPMMMPCGHVICKASLEKLARGIRPGASASGRFKCPYCPGMSGLPDAKRVHF
ncbi:hypothetical protein IWQ56_001582 [Coemansia nantahalensis]|uniref:Uncharacterized protein n=2 Tax=Coemansia TaxID=4863 RepID=A0ACC1LDB3_9FUNG|nr:hypothetical protein IWQ57_003450 [Coemansia nantahalensis]KAJ2771951.1 hypothetical protein IWQ56_001582 [Coemansia nantahalensis]KAJ2805921.1 hypothetical protein H4R21_001079 [Coemansia helicoidea]